MSKVTLFPWNDQLQFADVRELSLMFQITGAKTIVPVPYTACSYTSFDAISAQSVIDGFLGTTSEFLVAAFDSTSLGTDALGIIVNMKGQCSELYAMRYVSMSGTGGTTQDPKGFVSTAAGLTSSSLTNQCALGANGNIAGRIVSSGLDAITSGLILIQFYWRAK